MTRWPMRAGTGLVAMVATLLLVRFWYDRPDRFPGVLRELGLALIDRFGNHAAERSADLELLYLIAVAFAAVCLVLFVGILAWRFLAGRRTTRTDA